MSRSYELPDAILLKVQVDEAEVIIDKLVEENKKLRNALEDFVLEDDHEPSCQYRSRFGISNDCKCMDRVYYNKDACLIRAKELLRKLNNE